MGMMLQIAQLQDLLPRCLLVDQVALGSRLLRGLGARQKGRLLELPLDRWIERARASIEARHVRERLVDRVTYPAELPISSKKEVIVSALRQHKVVIVAGETGSGKSTQLPKMCLEAGFGGRGRVGCTQPRRVAALSISRRLAEELDVRWGSEVGCKIRFSDQSRRETAVKVMTDGMDGTFAFLRHNRGLTEKIELWQTRLPHRVMPDLDEALYGYYATRLVGVSSVVELDRVLEKAGGGKFLCAEAADLLGSGAMGFDAAMFPDELAVGDGSVPVKYAYAPGEDHDGVTLRLGVPLATVIEPGQLDWLVPALREERIAELLRRLPKALRRPLMPLAATAREMATTLDPQSTSFVRAMSDFVRQRHGVEIPLSEWALDALPAHLRPRYEVMGTASETIAAGRDLVALRLETERRETASDIEAWRMAAHRWERYGVTAWSFGDLPERFVVAEVTGLPLHGYPGFEVDEGHVNLRLFRRREEAVESSRRGIARLAGLTLRRELAWLEKDLRGSGVPLGAEQPSRNG
jgi:hypothetical protein